MSFTLPFRTKHQLPLSTKGIASVTQIALHMRSWSLVGLGEDRSAFRLAVVVILVGALILTPVLASQTISSESPSGLEEEDLIAIGVSVTTEAVVGTAVLVSTGNPFAAAVAGTLAGGAAALVTTALIHSLHDEIPDVSSAPPPDRVVEAQYVEWNSNGQDITQSPSFDPTAVVSTTMCPRCLANGVAPNAKE